MKLRDAEQLEVDERGVHVATLSVDFFSNTEAWDYLRRLKVPVQQDEDLWAARFYALPETLKKGAVYLGAFVHVHSNKRVHWIFRLERMPNTSPPEVIAESSALIGGYPHVLKSLEKDFSQNFLNSIEDTSFKVKYILPYEQWRPSLAGHSPPAPLSHGQMQLRLQQETWRLEAPDSILNTVAVRYEEDTFSLSVSGGWILPFSMDFPQRIEKQVWHELRPLLEG